MDRSLDEGCELEGAKIFDTRSGIGKLMRSHQRKGSVGAVGTSPRRCDRRKLINSVYSYQCIAMQATVSKRYYAAHAQNTEESTEHHKLNIYLRYIHPSISSSPHRRLLRNIRPSPDPGQRSNSPMHPTFRLQHRLQLHRPGLDILDLFLELPHSILNVLHLRH